MALENVGRERRTFRAALGELSLRLGRSIRASEVASARTLEVFERLSGKWADLPVGERAPWPNDICDDGSPFELSAAFNGGETELRMLVEPQEAPFTLASNWSAGLEVNAELERSEGASLARFERIAELFAPTEDDDAVFALWHAAVLDAEGKALFKAYLNPRVHGAERAPGLVRDAMRALGLEREAEAVAALIGEDGDALRYFSLDLSASEHARVKIYLACAESALSVERILSRSRNFEAGLASALLFALTGDLGPFDERPVLVCLAFDGAASAPVATLHVPVRSYCANDEAALSRVSGTMDAQEATLLRAAASAVAGVPLDASQGVITYASFRPGPRALRTTAYLAPMLYTRFEGRARSSSAPSSELHIPQ